MERLPVKSSNLKSIGYDESSSLLEVEFKDASIYHYFAVPINIFRGLMSANSKGSYLQDHVKDRYTYRKIK